MFDIGTICDAVPGYLFIAGLPDIILEYVIANTEND